MERNISVTEEVITMIIFEMIVDVKNFNHISSILSHTEAE